ncbi:MAG: MBL fold metallo-hydrolase [Acidimicrobiales bacterium]
MVEDPSVGAGAPHVVPIETPGLGDRSYLIHDGVVGAVIDPQRDIDRILDIAAAAEIRITHVAETHIHNDYVTGGLELAGKTGATYLVAGEDEVDYHRRSVADGDVVEVGGFSLRVLATPGHTAHHVSYVAQANGVPAAVFTGGSLLYGTVGRTDLVSDSLTDELTHAQYRSAHRLVAELPAEVPVWPTHGFGSFCSSAKSSGASTSTIGDEARTNLALTIEDEDAFVARLLSGLTAYPRYYAQMAPINRSGPAPVDLSPVTSVDPTELRRRIHAGEWVVDLRQRRAFARTHLPGTVSVELGDPFATYLGWVLPWGSPITLIGDSAGEIAEAQRALVRIGIDRPSGAATGPIETLVDGDAIGSYEVASFADLAAALSQDRPLTVLDVRRPDERAAGGIRDSVHIPLHELAQRIDSLPAGPLWLHCASGFRASIGASILDRAGREVVLIDDDWEHAAQNDLPIA